MNTVRMGVITFCVAVGASVYLSLRGAAIHDAQPVQVTPAQTAKSKANHRAVSVNAEHALNERTLNTVSESAFEPDSADLLQQPSLTLDELLDAVIADIDSEDEQVDREALGEMLRSDPALARVLTY